MRLKSYVRGFVLTVPATEYQRYSVRRAYRYLRQAGISRRDCRREIVHLLHMFAPDTSLREVTR